MSWQIEFTRNAQKAMEELDKSVRKRIDNFLKRLVAREHPRSIGGALSGTLAGRWRYRVGSYRIVCEIHDDVLVVLVLEVDHRREVYKRK